MILLWQINPLFYCTNIRQPHWLWQLQLTLLDTMAFVLILPKSMTTPLRSLWRENRRKQHSLEPIFCIIPWADSATTHFLRKLFRFSFFAVGCCVSAKLTFSSMPMFYLHSVGINSWQMGCLPGTPAEDRVRRTDKFHFLMFSPCLIK